MKKVVIHSDGACHGNPGPGGWAATLACDAKTREISGGVAATTNNRMELQAAIEALGVLKESCEIEFYTDSVYLRSGVTAWVKGWKRNGWRTSTKQPVKNEDLWRKLDALTAGHKVTWHWVKGHAGHEGNEKCDGLATAEILKIKESHTAEQLKAALDQFVQGDKAPVPQDLFARILEK